MSYYSADGPQKLDEFCNAIREKMDWEFKILDETKGLAKKWAIEAGLLKEGDILEETTPLALALNELKEEARRINALDHKIRLHGKGLPPRVVDFEMIDTEIENALKYVRGSKYGLRAPTLKEEVGVFVSDGIVPLSLHKELVKEFDRLASLEPQDFHPHTNGKMAGPRLDSSISLSALIPSDMTVELTTNYTLLDPYVAGVSPISVDSKTPPLHNGKFRTQKSTRRVDLFESRYSWIPSEFFVSEDGTRVNIPGYINGLGTRDNFTILYQLIERVFLFALPHFERTMGFEYKPEHSPSVKRWFARAIAREGTTQLDWDNILREQKLEREREEDDQWSQVLQMEAEIISEQRNRSQFLNQDRSSLASPWKGRNLKVIVKAANYILQPGQKYSGTWHVEGMPHERIVASMIYYYDADSRILDEGLSLRRNREPEKDFPSSDEIRHESFNLYITTDSRPKIRDDSEEDEDEEEDEEPIDDYPSDWEYKEDYEGVLRPTSTTSLSAYIGLGTVPTTNISPPDAEASNAGELGTGRIVSFPNWIQHKVEGLKHKTSLPGEGKGATRNILCFFLVDDDDIEQDRKHYHGFTYTGLKNMSVLTTKDVYSQANACNAPTLRFLIPYICHRLIGRTLPPELCGQILQDVDLGTTRADVERNRRGVIEDRKIKSNPRYENYSLCEH